MSMELFRMERMQSTWENIVDYDMSESGIRAVTLREMTKLGFDLEEMLDTPLGYSQSNGTIALRERLAALYPGATADHIEVTNGTSEANYLLALSQLRQGDRFALEVPNYMQLWGVPRSVGADVDVFHLRPRDGARWELDWEEFERAVRPGTKLVYITNPNNPTGSVLSAADMRRIVERCEMAGAYLIADEVYQGAELADPITPSFWGMSDRVIVTSGLSKAYGIPGVRIGWIVAQPDVVAQCWMQHDYLTIGPNKLSDALARVAVEPTVREHLYGRTRTILNENEPVVEEWVASFGDFLTHIRPAAAAMAFIRYASDRPSETIADWVRTNQSTLIVPGSHLGLEGYLRIWTGGKPEFLREGLRRVGVGLEALRSGELALAGA
ncbi:MAG TPA: aminotransferase class I/II-fold pyridoxal phosphate-dependent enzyme [Gemmatimonadaceae bacterium]|nr:aminotransferase class I/II-fold pyridoxal phosphate-dependent enzyme [Gemmatimonadaceae bacterium]